MSGETTWRQQTKTSRSATCPHPIIRDRLSTTGSLTCHHPAICCMTQSGMSRVAQTHSTLSDKFSIHSVESSNSQTSQSIPQSQSFLQCRAAASLQIHILCRHPCAHLPLAAPADTLDERRQQLVLVVGESGQPRQCWARSVRRS